jgi:hypothetical protein
MVPAEHSAENTIGPTLHSAAAQQRQGKTFQLWAGKSTCRAYLFAFWHMCGMVRGVWSGGCR